MYCTADEQTKYHEELKQIVKCFRNGAYKAVKAGEDITLGDIKLYSLLLEIDEAACPAYFLLRGRGESDDLYYIPYFFKTMKSRDMALLWIMKKTNVLYHGDDYPERQMRFDFWSDAFLKSHVTRAGNSIWLFPTNL